MPRKLLTKGVLRFQSEDGEREIGVALYEDETYSLLTQAEKAKLFPTPANPRPTGSDGERPGAGPPKFFKPPTQGKRMPNGLWNSSVPLPGHDIGYSEGEVKRK